MSTDTNLLLRVLIVGDEGDDVYGVKRSLHRFLKTGKLADVEAKPEDVQRRFQPEMATLVRRVQAKLGNPADGRVGPATERGLRKAGAFDAKSIKLLADYRARHDRPRLVWPHAAGATSSICQGLHDTAGLPGNVAFDWCARGGTVVVACFDAEIVKFSGRDPNGAWDQRVGIGGWSIHYWSVDNVYRAFSTHYGQRLCQVGQRVRPGDPIGIVASWPGNPGRSHTHLGVSSTRGRDDAINLLSAISRAPRWEAA